MPEVEIIDFESHLVDGDRAEATLGAMEHALHDMRPVMHELLDDFHVHTAEWMDSLGDGTWPALEPETIASKARMGYPNPGRPLFASGMLFDSAEGHGPYTVEDVSESQAWMGLDWERDGWNIPALHQEGVPWREVTQHRHHKDGSPYTVTYMWHLPERQIFQIDQALVDAGASQIVAHVFNPLG